MINMINVTYIIMSVYKCDKCYVISCRSIYNKLVKIIIPESMKSFYHNLFKDCHNDVRRDTHFFFLQYLLTFFVFFLRENLLTWWESKSNAYW